MAIRTQQDRAKRLLSSERWIRAVDRRLRTAVGALPRRVETRWLGRDLLVFEGSARHEPEPDSAWTWALLSRSKVFFDVGANIGQTALMAMIAGVQHLVIVEATPLSMRLCIENLTANFPGRPFSVVLCFVSDANDGTTPLYVSGAGAANSRYAGHAVTAARSRHVLEVPNRSLDRIAADLQVQPDLVKIDIEGAEADALDGAIRIAERSKSRFVVEMHSNPELTMQANATRVLSWCDRVGYHCYYLKEHRLLSNPEDIAHRGRCHLLLQPKGAEYPAELVGVEQGAPIRTGA